MIGRSISYGGKENKFCGTGYGRSADSMWQPCVGVMTVKFPQH